MRTEDTEEKLPLGDYHVFDLINIVHPTVTQLVDQVVDQAIAQPDDDQATIIIPPDDKEYDFEEKFNVTLPLLRITSEDSVSEDQKSATPPMLNRHIFWQARVTSELESSGQGGLVPPPLRRAESGPS